MSHPVRTSPHLLHLHNAHHRNYHHLNRIDEEQDEEPDNHHHQPQRSLLQQSMSIESQWFETPPSKNTSSKRNSINSSDEEEGEEGENDINRTPYSINNDNDDSSNHNGLRNDSNASTSSTSAILLPDQQRLLNKEILQRRLRFFFMSPLDKWRTKRRFPLKMLFQLAKIVFVTAQIMYFGNEMSSYLNYEDNTRTAFREMLLSGWDTTREVFTYPPSNGAFAVYRSDDFYKSINYAIRQYANLTNQSVGSFGYDTGGPDDSPSPPPLSSYSSSSSSPVVLLEKRSYTRRVVDPSKYVFDFNDQIVTDWLTIADLYPAGDSRWLDFDAKRYFAKHNFTINFDTMIALWLRFPLRTIYYNSENDLVRCYELNVSIRYDNAQHDGEIPVSLTTDRRVHRCETPTRPRSTTTITMIKTLREYSTIVTVQQALNWIVLVACTISIILCIRSIYRGQLLRAETDQFFAVCFERRLSFNESIEFLDLWIVMIVINDVLIICGTIIKMRLESTDMISGAIYTHCSLMLGVGNLLVWCGMLRYLSYFQSYNILIITIRRSLPNIFRFLFCAILIYGGFCFCGWVVLGPYHLKFRTLSSTSECLFSLMNGDDMFATFFSTDIHQHNVIWWFSRIYFYFFISLSIYVIVSIFIAIILDSYESIRDYYLQKETQEFKSPLQKFIEEYPIEGVDGDNFTNNSIVDHIYRHVSRWFAWRGVRGSTTSTSSFLAT